MTGVVTSSLDKGLFQHLTRNVTSCLRSNIISSKSELFFLDFCFSYPFYHQSIPYAFPVDEICPQPKPNHTHNYSSLAVEFEEV